MDRGDFFYRRFKDFFPYDGTEDQDRLFREIAGFVTCDDADILVVNGYAGTGKTSAIASVIQSFDDLRPRTRNDELEEICFLLAPTGRAAKVLSSYAGKPASTIHKCIYRQKSVGDDGFGQFSLAPNKLSHKLFIVDEVSLIGIEDAHRQGTTQFGTGDLLKDLIDYVRAGNDCRLILIGDDAQLPPVGMEASPALSKECMDCFGGVRYCSLRQVVRQQKEFRNTPQRHQAARADSLGSLRGRNVHSGRAGAYGGRLRRRGADHGRRAARCPEHRLFL